MEVEMNWDQVAGNWKQLKGVAKEKWGRLTDDDLEMMAGQRDQHFEIVRSEEHTSELQSLMRISYAVFCLKKKKRNTQKDQTSYKIRQRPYKQREKINTKYE